MIGRITTACLTLWLAAAQAEPLTGEQLKQFDLVAKTIESANGFALLEGLPHQRFEREKLETELAAKKTVRVQGYPFYERPLEVSGDVVKSLRQLCASATSCEAYRGPKKCGGFHPDYCLVWKDGDIFCQLLICFGCREMKLHGPGMELLVDVRPDTYKKLGDILKPLRSQRPPSRQ